MKNFGKAIILLSVMPFTNLSANLNVMTQSVLFDPITIEQIRHSSKELINPEGQEENSDFLNVRRPKNKQDLIKEAALMATAAYNHQDIVNIKSKDIRYQDNQLAREQLAENGDEVISFSATIKESKFFAHGQLPAGLVCFSEDENGKAKIKISFHGTENQRDLATDCNVSKVSAESLLTNGKIHGGFYNRYMESREAMFDVIQGVLDAHGLNANEVDFLVSGHSLGAALATIAAVDLKKNIASQAKLDLITFCSPRVFNKDGAQEVENLLQDRIIRVWREKDPVSAVSLGINWLFPIKLITLGYINLTGYKHVGKSIKLESTKDSISMENHAMNLMLDAALSERNVAFCEQHEGFKQRLAKKVNPIAKSIKDLASNIGNKLKFWGKN